MKYRYMRTLEDIKELGSLPMIRIEIGAKWFDDFIDNLKKEVIDLEKSLY